MLPLKYCTSTYSYCRGLQYNGWRGHMLPQMLLTDFALGIAQMSRNDGNRVLCSCLGCQTEVSFNFSHKNTQAIFETDIVPVDYHDESPSYRHPRPFLLHHVAWLRTSVPSPKVGLQERMPRAEIHHGKSRSSRRDCGASSSES
jgi:hypothetical protein